MRLDMRNVYIKISSGEMRDAVMTYEIMYGTSPSLVVRSIDQLKQCCISLVINILRINCKAVRAIL
jgi:hypothetical protein